MDKNNSTTSGISYSYSLPKEYRSTTTTNISTYKIAKEYGACKGAQIVPPTPSSPLPELFRHMRPHNMPKKYVVSNEYIPNRDYHNRVLYNSSNSASQLANQNSTDTYRIISMPNSALSCGGVSSNIYNPSHYKPGFNEVISSNNYYQ